MMGFLMSEPINFIVTKVGRLAAIDAAAIGIKLTLSKVGLGSGQYIPTADRTEMAAKFTDKGISAGGVEETTGSLRFTMIMSHTLEKNVTEIGIYTSTGVLFAVASKPQGYYFRLYPSLDYVANFGLPIENALSPNNIEVVTDGTAPLAATLMQAHSLAEDPHPQYTALANAMMQAHLDAADPHPQYALKTFLNDETKKLDDQIKNLIGITQVFFPPLLRMGSDMGANSIATLPPGAHYSLQDAGLVYMYCQESQHEGWSTTREANQIKTYAYNRSGTNRIDSTGRGNWLVLDTIRTLSNKGFIAPGNQFDNEIKSGVFNVGQTTKIIRESWEELRYTDPRVVLLISPEGAHEGWEITRTDAEISINVYERSGTNRIPYTGRINWSLMKAKAVPPDLAGSYPKLVLAGTADGANFSINAPTDMDFTDPNYAVFVTPDNQNEGWTIGRSSERFNVAVYNRSGTNQSAYSGRVNWAVFAIKRPIKRVIYYEGQHQVAIKPGQKVTIDLFAAGGGGGGSIHNYSSQIWNIPSNGGDGGDIVLQYGPALLTAGGGKGGGGANWGNGSSFTNGAPGPGGKNTINELGSFKLLESQNGNDAIRVERWVRQPGGVATSLISGLQVNNAGGQGAWGIGDEKWSYGGGGGSGAYMKLEFINTSQEAVNLSLNVGKKGAGWKAPTAQTNGNPGDDGGVGFAILSFEV